MIIRFTAAATVALMLIPLVARAAESTVVLNVANANCELCAPIVKKSLARVAGVKAVEVKQTDQMAEPVATVTFDDTVTSIAALIAATTNAGYPSRPVAR